MNRWFFALKHAWGQRKVLKSFLTERNKQIYSLSEITPARLDAAQVAILVLDFDGVLAHHDAKEPNDEALKWLRNLSMNIGEQRIALLTNKPKRNRLEFFNTHFPSIHIVSGVRKKPYPDGLAEVANYKGVAPHRVLLLDDRLLTGMLATCLSYSQGWYFRKPYSNYWKNPIRESFFSFLRGFERLWISMIG